MHEDTAWGLLPDGLATRRVRDDNGHRLRETKNRTVIPFSSTQDANRHGINEQGLPKNYKGYVGGSNFCMDIVLNEKGKWEGEIVSTFAAYQLVREFGEKIGVARLQSKTQSVSGKPLVMRLQNGDTVMLKDGERYRLMRIVKMNSQGQISFAGISDANISTREADKTDSFNYFRKNAGPLQGLFARKVTLSPIGELRVPDLRNNQHDRPHR